MSAQHTAPCAQCPFRRDSLRGWLGAATPEEFIAQSESELRMPCHMQVDYERDGWEHRAAKAPQCAGRAIHFANRCKVPRDPKLLRLPADRAAVFTQPQDFLQHHMPLAEDA